MKKLYTFSYYDIVTFGDICTFGGIVASGCTVISKKILTTTFLCRLFMGECG